MTQAGRSPTTRLKRRGRSSRPRVCARSRRARTGGNLDIRRLVAGSTLLLPVHVPGALLSLGDVHFAQGDGEVRGTGIEIEGGRASTGRASPVRATGPRASRVSHAGPRRVGRASATTGIPLEDAMDLTVAARTASSMIDWLEGAKHGLSAGCVLLCLHASTRTCPRWWMSGTRSSPYVSCSTCSSEPGSSADGDRLDLDPARQR